MPATKAADSEPTPDMVNMPNIRHREKYETGEKAPFGAAAAIAAQFALRQPRGQPQPNRFGVFGRSRIRPITRRAWSMCGRIFPPKRGHG